MSYKVTLTLFEDATENDAFGDTREDAAQEVVRILRATANRLESNMDSYGRCFETIFDVNGNDVGRFGMKDA